MSDTKLLPCPFCGSSARVSKYKHCPDIVQCEGCGVYTEPHLWNRRAGPVIHAASEQALAEAHAEIARLRAQYEETREQLKEALVGVTYGRMCEKELRALRDRINARRNPLLAIVDWHGQGQEI